MKHFKCSVLSEKVVEREASDGDVSSESDISELDHASSEESEEDIADSEDEDQGEETGSTPLAKGNAGWADAMSKILKTNKPKKKKTIVLARAKTIQAAQVGVKKKEDIGFEIEGEIKEEKPSIDEIQLAKPKKVENLPSVRRKEWKSRGRTKPMLKDQEREKILSKIAIKGVVQLFNAVQKHQTELGKKLKEAGPSEVKRERVLKSIDKRAFLDVLMGNAKSQKVDDPLKTETKIELKAEEPKSSAWTVLREDFLTDTTLKDWDKKQEVDEDEEMPQESLSSDDEVEMI